MLKSWKKSYFTTLLWWKIINIILDILNERGVRNVIKKKQRFIRGMIN